MRARPEQTQLEDLSDASFLGKLLVLPADWKMIARYKHSSLFGLIICNKEKSFITLGPGGQSYLVYPWKSGQIYRFLIRASPQQSSGSTVFTGKADFQFITLNPGTHTYPGNTKGGSITVLLTSCLTGLESAV